MLRIIKRVQVFSWTRLIIENLKLWCSPLANGFILVGCADTLIIHYCFFITVTLLNFIFKFSSGISRCMGNPEGEIVMVYL